MADAEQVKDAAEVYVYGCPLVYDLKEVASFVEGGGQPAPPRRSACSPTATTMARSPMA